MLQQLKNKVKATFEVVNKYLIALTLISTLLIIWQEFGMVLEFKVPSSAYSRSVGLSDHVNDGKSVSKIESSSNKVSMSCKTVHSKTFPFCSTLIPLGKETQQVVDLSNYERLSITLSYNEKSKLEDSILIYLLNDEHLSTSLNTFDSMRANQAALIPEFGKTTYQLPLSQFSVPSWWTYGHPNEQQSTIVDQVKFIQVATGDSYELKDVSIDIERITFTGKWISKLELYQLIIMAWLSSAIIYAAITTRRHIKKLTKFTQKLHIEKQDYLRQSQYDHLTNTLNRQGLSKVYERMELGSCMILLDIDDFKSINDTYGHDEGDRILVEIATKLSNTIEDNCHLSRWGGEEFLILCEGVSLHDTGVIAEKLRGELESTVRLPNQTPVTCTLGVSQINQDFDSSLKQADLALYEGKHRGKNLVILSQ